MISAAQIKSESNADRDLANGDTSASALIEACSALTEALREFSMVLQQVEPGFKKQAIALAKALERVLTLLPRNGTAAGETQTGPGGPSEVSQMETSSDRAELERLKAQIVELQAANAASERNCCQLRADLVRATSRADDAEKAAAPAKSKRTEMANTLSGLRQSFADWISTAPVVLGPTNGFREGESVVSTRSNVRVDGIAGSDHG